MSHRVFAERIHDVMRASGGLTLALTALCGCGGGGGGGGGGRAEGLVHSNRIAFVLDDGASGLQVLRALDPGLLTTDDSSLDVGPDVPFRAGDEWFATPALAPDNSKLLALGASGQLVRVDPRPTASTPIAYLDLVAGDWRGTGCCAWGPGDRVVALALDDGGLPPFDAALVGTLAADGTCSSVLSVAADPLGETRLTAVAFDPAGGRFVVGGFGVDAPGGGAPCGLAVFGDIPAAAYPPATLAFLGADTEGLTIRGIDWIPTTVRIAATLHGVGDLGQIVNEILIWDVEASAEVRRIPVAPTAAHANAEGLDLIVLTGVAASPDATRLAYLLVGRSFDGTVLWAEVRAVGIDGAGDMPLYSIAMPTGVGFGVTWTK